MVFSSTLKIASVLTDQTNQKHIQHVRDHDGGSTENRGSLKAENAARGVGTRNVLEKQVTGRRKGHNHDRQEEGDVECSMRKHEPHRRKTGLERGRHLSTRVVVRTGDTWNRSHRLRTLGRGEEGIKRSSV